MHLFIFTCVIGNQSKKKHDKWAYYQWKTPIKKTVFLHKWHAKIYSFTDNHKEELERPNVDLISEAVEVKKALLEISQNSQENTCAIVSFSIKLQLKLLFFNKLAIKSPQACYFIKKETLAHVLSCEFCEISKNTFFL